MKTEQPEFFKELADFVKDHLGACSELAYVIGESSSYYSLRKALTEHGKEIAEHFWETPPEIDCEGECDECRDANDDINHLEKEIIELKIKAGELPEINTLIQKMKHEMLLRNIDGFTLTELEEFVNMKRLKKAS